MKVIKPTDKQKEAIPYIKWLYSPFGHNGEGRTMAIVMAVIELATENPGEKIYYKDFIGPVERNHFREEVTILLNNNYKETRFKYLMDRNSITFKE